MDYEKLSQTDSSEFDLPPRRSTRVNFWRSALPLGYAALLLLSFCLNGFFVFDHLIQKQVRDYGHAEHAIPEFDMTRAKTLPGTSSIDQDDISPYADVPRNVIRPLVEHTSYHNPENWTASHEMWASMDIDYSVVALTDEFAQSKGLLTAQRFPWDTSKGIYILHGMHNLHCLKILYLAHVKFRDNRPQTIPWEHLSHCFDSIRQQIICDADDTLRASFAGQQGVSGIGQSRVCRNWDVYEQWAKDHTACYHRENDPDYSSPSIDHYKYCPEGSGYVIPDVTNARG